MTPPTCSFCPGDIVREEPNAYERVSWDDLKCSDNFNVPPVITSNYPNSSLFKVPGACFSKVPIINGSGKLSPFSLKIGVSMVLHVT